MDYQILVNIAVGIGTLMGGWIFKMMMGHINEIKSDHNELMKKHHEDIEKMSDGEKCCAFTCCMFCTLLVYLIVAIDGIEPT